MIKDDYLIKLEETTLRLFKIINRASDIRIWSKTWSINRIIFRNM